MIYIKNISFHVSWMRTNDLAKFKFWTRPIPKNMYIFTWMLFSHHIDVCYAYLQESCHIDYNIPEDVIFLLAVEPAKLGDSGIKLDQGLCHKGSKLWPGCQIIEYIISWGTNDIYFTILSLQGFFRSKSQIGRWYKLTNVNALLQGKWVACTRHQLGETRCSQQLRVRGLWSKQIHCQVSNLQFEET